MKNTVFPHKFWRPFLDCMPQLFFRPQYVWFAVHLKGHLIPLCYETLVVNWQNWLFTLFHQSRSVLSPNPILHAAGVGLTDRPAVISGRYNKYHSLQLQNYYAHLPRLQHTHIHANTTMRNWSWEWSWVSRHCICWPWQEESCVIG